MVVNDEVLNVVYIGAVDGYLLGSDCKTETLLFMLYLCCCIGCHVCYCPSKCLPFFLF